MFKTSSSPAHLAADCRCIPFNNAQMTGENAKMSTVNDCGLRNHKFQRTCINRKESMSNEHSYMG